jgi:ribonuclease P protein component
MLPQKNRLPRFAFRAPGYRTVSSPYFSLKAKDNELLLNRIGVVVGKSVDKRAARRNFWERQGKTELLRAPSFNKDFILTVFPKVKTLTKRQFGEEIKKLLNKLT